MTFTWTISHTNRPPQLTNPGTLSNYEGDYVSFQISASDPDNDTLSFSASGLPSGLSMSSTGLITGTIDYGAAGSYSITICVSDGNGGSDSTTFNWNVSGY
jgi:hypothetical protein